MSILADVKTQLEITGTNFDIILTSIILSVLTNADEYLGMIFCQTITENTEYFDGGENILYCAYVNLSNISVYDDDTLLDEGNEEDYVVYADRGIIRKVTGDFTSGMKRVRVIYDGGYSEDNIPSAIRSKLVKQIGYEFRRRKDPGLQSVSFPDGSINKYNVDEWLPDVKAELNRHRRIYL